VETRAGAARAKFQKLPAVEARKTFVALPVILNGKPSSFLAPADLQDTTAHDRWCLLLKGKGGLGKSTLAFQLGLWAIAENPAERLCRDRKMIPILIEPQIKFDVRSDVPTFKRALRGNLQQLLGAKDPVSEGLFEQLLRNRYILVILDGLSEMPTSPAGPGTARPEHADFPVNALVVTSRVDEKLNVGWSPELRRSVKTLRTV
jgi:hypothetical protein